MSPEPATMSSVLNRQQSKVQIVSNIIMKDQFDYDDEEGSGQFLQENATDVNGGDNYIDDLHTNFCGSNDDAKLSFAKLDVVNNSSSDRKISIGNEDLEGVVEANHKSDKDVRKLITACSLGLLLSNLFFVINVAAADILHVHIIVEMLLVQLLFNIFLVYQYRNRFLKVHMCIIIFFLLLIIYIIL